MRVAFMHEAALRLEEGSDPRAPGAAVTVELCGHWEHEDPCRWPHLSAVAERTGDDLTLRVLFVATPEDEREVRTRIVRGLRRGCVESGPLPSRWAVLREEAAELRADEVRQAEHLARC